MCHVELSKTFRRALKLLDKFQISISLWKWCGSRISIQMFGISVTPITSTTQRNTVDSIRSLCRPGFKDSDLLVRSTYWRRSSLRDTSRDYLRIDMSTEGLFECFIVWPQYPHPSCSHFSTELLLRLPVSREGFQKLRIEHVLSLCCFLPKNGCFENKIHVQERRQLHRY